MEIVEEPGDVLSDPVEQEDRQVADAERQIETTCEVITDWHGASVSAG